MNKIKILLFILTSLLYSSNKSNAQSRPFSSLSIESSYSRTPLDDFPDPLTGELHRYYQSIWYNALFTNLSRRWYMGLQYSALKDSYQRATVERYYLLGLVNRYELPIIPPTLSVQGDLGVHKGNICNCLKDLRQDNWPFKVENSTYLNLGVNFKIQVVRPLHLLLGFNSYFILGTPYDDYAYVQLMTGVHLRFGGYPDHQKN